jgi:hypothetical protein
MPARNNRGVTISDAYSRCYVAPAAYACALSSHNNSRRDAGGVPCGSASRLHDSADRVQLREWVQCSWGFSCGVNQRATEEEESPLLRHCRGISIAESCYQVKTSESRLRRLSVEWFVVWKSAIVLQLFVVTTFRRSINLFINPEPRL